MSFSKTEDRNKDFLFWFQLFLNNPVHFFRGFARNPDFSAILADQNISLFKKIEFFFPNSIQHYFLFPRLSAANSTQSILNHITLLYDLLIFA